MNNIVIKTRPFYSESFKLSVVMRVVNGELSRDGARREYGIGGNTTILKWMKKFGYYSNPYTPPPMAESTDEQDPKELKKRVQQLEKQLHNERIRSKLYQTMIDVAERELGISIRKKSDTNPSD